MDSGADPWNGPSAQALRASVLDGSYRYCHLERCATTLLTEKELRVHQSQPGELPISAGNLDALLAGKTILPEGPAALTVMGDPRCNLACGSCRPSPILQNSPAIEDSVRQTLNLLATHGKSLRIVKLAGDGEVFFSPALREILRSFSRDRFPKLEKVDVLTNGILFDADTLQALTPGSDFIRSVNVSIDAGDDETYQKVRGGDWARLLQNLLWMAKQRKIGRFDFLGLTYVLRAENFRSLPAFLSLAESLGADEVYVSRLFPWERMGISFAKEAVHLPEHPEYAEFLALWKNERAPERSFRWRTNLE